MPVKGTRRANLKANIYLLRFLPTHFLPGVMSDASLGLTSKLCANRALVLAELLNQVNKHSGICYLRIKSLKLFHLQQANKGITSGKGHKPARASKLFQERRKKTPAAR